MIIIFVGKKNSTQILHKLKNVDVNYKFDIIKLQCLRRSTNRWI